MASKASGKAKPRAYVETKGGLAAAAGISWPTLNVLLSKRGAPKKGPRGWDVEAVQSFRARSDSVNGKARGGVMAGLREREVRLRIESAELEMKHKRGEYVLAESVRIEARKVVESFKRDLLDLPSQLAALCGGMGPEIEKHLVDGIKEAIEKLRKSIEAGT